VGTSKSYGGPSDKTPLLPDWAFSPPEDEEPPPEENLEQQNESLDTDEEPIDELESESDSEEENNEESGEDDGPGSQKGGDDPGVLGQASSFPRGSWKSAKTLYGKAVKNNGDSRSFRKAARSYVRAHGGPRNAARTATSGRSATARLGGFLADVANRGLNAALDGLNLSAVVGKDPRTVFAAIANAIAPDGASPEQAVAREAVDDVLANLYQRFVVEEGDLSRLNALTGEDVSKAMLDSVTSYIYHRWLQELGRQIEEKSLSSSQAVRLEREAKLFVRESVALDLSGKDLLSLNWATDGHALVERIYREAYSLFGAGR
jgi:hypothetical protein